MQLQSTNSEELTAREIFQIVIDFFKSKYPHRRISMVDNLVYIDSNIVFNIEGYNLLFNLHRLVSELEGELK